MYISPHSLVHTFVKACVSITKSLGKREKTVAILSPHTAASVLSRAFRGGNFPPKNPTFPPLNFSLDGEDIYYTEKLSFELFVQTKLLRVL